MFCLFVCLCQYFLFFSWPNKSHCQHLVTLPFPYPVAVAGTSVTTLPDVPLPPSYGRPPSSAWREESHSLDFSGEYEKEKQLPVFAALFQTSLIKKPFAQEGECSFFFHLSPIAQIESTSHCLTWKWKLENVLLVAIFSGGGDQLSASHIFYYSVSQAWFFWSFQPNAHLIITYYHCKAFRRFHLPFRLWKKILEKTPLCLPTFKPPLLKSSRAAWSLLEANVGVFRKTCRNGFSIKYLAVSLFLSPLHFPLNSYHIYVQWDWQLWGEEGLVQNE